jgi:hypothetical protein
MSPRRPGRSLSLALRTVMRPLPISAQRLPTAKRVGVNRAWKLWHRLSELGLEARYR